MAASPNIRGSLQKTHRKILKILMKRYLLGLCLWEAKKQGEKYSYTELLRIRTLEEGPQK